MCPVPATIVLSASKKFNTHIPLGDQVCFNHLKLETKEESNKTLSSPNAQATFPKETLPSDEMFVPEDIAISEDVLDTASVSETNLSFALGASPIQYEIKRNRVSDLAESVKQKRLKEHRNNQKESALGQSEEFINGILSNKIEESSTEKEAREEQIRMSTISQENDAISGLIVLSLVGHQK